MLMFLQKEQGIELVSMLWIGLVLKMWEVVLMILELKFDVGTFATLNSSNVPAI